MEQHKKRLEKKKSKKRKIIIILIAILIIIALIVFYILRSNTADLEEITDYEYENTIENELTEEPTNELDEGIEIVDVSEMPSRANGYKVMGQIVLEKIGIQCYIFDTSSKEERVAALKVGTVRFRGPDVNEPGNICIEGHNYRKVFTRLTEMEIGDTFYIVGRDGRKVTYEIKEMIHNVEPNDMSHTSQETGNIRKVTLITCDPRRTHEVFSKSRAEKMSSEKL